MPSQPRPPELSVTHADSCRRDLLCWGLLAIAVLLVAMAAPFAAGRVPTRDDLGAYHLPVRAFYAEQLARGETFDWMPQLYCGFYVTGEGQAGMYHPLHRLAYRWLPLPAALAVEWLSPYVFMAVGTWLFLRRRLQQSEAALLGAIAFTFCGPNMLRFVHPNATAVIAHLPWLLWTIDVVLVDARRSKVALAQAGIALLIGSELLLGYPQYVWFSLLVGTAYTVFVVVERRFLPREGCHDCTTCSDCIGCKAGSWSRVAVAAGVGLLVGAVQWLPTLDSLAESTRRGADATLACFGSLHPLNLIQLVAPYLFAERVAGGNTHELTVYAGAAPLALVAWLVGRSGRLEGWRRFAWAAALLGALAVVMALGCGSPLYRLQTWLPVVGAFRFPCRYMVLFQFALAVLAAIAFALLARQCREARRGRRAVPSGAAHPAPGEAAPGGEEPCLPPVAPGWAWSPFEYRRWRQFEPLGLLVGASAAVAVTGVVLRGHPMIAAVPWVLVGPALFAGAALMVVAAARGHQAGLVGLVLLTAADLGCYGMSYAVWPEAMSPAQFLAATPAPPSVVDGRVVAEPDGGAGPGVRIGNAMTLAGWYRADGYAGLEPARRLALVSLPALRAAGVRWVRRDPGEAPPAGLAARTRRWLEVPEPLPLARLVTRVAVRENPGAELPGIDVDTTALCEVPLLLPASPPGTVELLARRPGALLMATDAAATQLLVVAERYHRGWQATVDRRPQPVLRVNGDFMGCLVPKGRHRVVFRFDPQSLRRGRSLSAVGLTLVGLMSACVWLGVDRGAVEKKKPWTRLT